MTWEALSAVAALGRFLFRCWSSLFHNNDKVQKFALVDAGVDTGTIFNHIPSTLVGVRMIALAIERKSEEPGKGSSTHLDQ